MNNPVHIRFRVCWRCHRSYGVDEKHCPYKDCGADVSESDIVES